MTLLPLDKKFVDVIDEAGVKKKVSALDPRWVSDLHCIAYEAPPLMTADPAQFEEWAERLTFVEEDLHMLLSLPHDKFWCQVIFDEGVQLCIDSYLRYAPRQHDVVYELPAECQERHSRVHRQVFMVCLRMATHKESKENFITPEVFGDILYENFIFDIPKLMDLCVLYGSANGLLLTKMIENIFKCQPKYKDDLAAVVPTVAQVFESIERKCTESGSIDTPLKLSNSRRQDVLQKMSTTEFQDLIFYFLDTSATLWHFLEVYPAAAEMFRQQDFHIKLCQLYEAIVPVLKNVLLSREWPSSSLQQLLMRQLHAAQTDLLRAFYQVIFSTCLQPILENCESKECGNHIEDYLQQRLNIISEKKFLGHLESLFPLQEDLDVISQARYTIDETRIQFLIDAVREAKQAHGKSHRRKKSAAAPPGSSGGMMLGAGAGAGAGVGAEFAEPSSGAAADFVDEGVQVLEGACAPSISGVELDSLITSVRDLLPDLGEGFIEACLEEYNYDVEKVINGVLEDQLPASLQDLDRLMKRKPKPVPEETPEDMLSQRANIYDDDEFDVFSKKSIDLTKVHRGKREDISSGLSMLDDKTDLADIRDRYDKYANETTLSSDEEGGINPYEDEYDDTYDTNQIGAHDDDSADELATRRPFTVPRILEIRRGNQGSGENTLSESSDEESPARDQFIQDPAVLRQRAEERQAWKQARRNPKQNPAQGPKPRDVVGGAKGQGQSADVVRNRAFKDKQKSSRANHNRRVLADKKRRV